MKTSIIVSSVAVLCMMLSIAEAPTGKKNDNVRTTPANELSYITIYSPASSNAGRLTSVKHVKEMELPATTNDLSYLKFDLSGYINDDGMDQEVSDEITFDYLKFNASDYTSETEPASLESTGNDFGYLKFDVSSYFNESEESSFDYLKFNVTDYCAGENISMTKETEMPENDFENLKFDVNHYTNNEYSAKISDLPENDFSYLKFDVNKFLNQYTDAASTEELPSSGQN